MLDYQWHRISTNSGNKGMKTNVKSLFEFKNVIGFALGAKPASIKNYRDEFDPVFPNKRKGWHKRPMRNYCKQKWGVTSGQMTKSTRESSCW